MPNTDLITNIFRNISKDSVVQKLTTILLISINPGMALFIYTGRFSGITVASLYIINMLQSLVCIFTVFLQRKESLVI